jgi:hypothetical protein
MEKEMRKEEEWGMGERTVLDSILHRLKYKQ